MQDSFVGNRDGLPIFSRIPILGDAASFRNDTVRKSELVIFLRATVIRDASLDGDLADYRKYLPDAQFFRDPSPSIDLSTSVPWAGGTNAADKGTTPKP
jgi:general secretion pathway protein D